MTVAVKVGQVFHSSWGYDQTNVNFFGVVRVSASGKTAWFVELTKVSLGSSERQAGNAAQCRYCGEGVRQLVKVDGSVVWRHVATGETECKFYGYRREYNEQHGIVRHADVEVFKRRVRQTGDYGGEPGGLAANWTDYASMYHDPEDFDEVGNSKRTHYETPAGAGH